MKIKQEQISQMQTMKMEGKKNKEIAEFFKVSISTIQYHLNEETKKRVKSKSLEYQRNLSPEKKKEIQDRQRNYQRSYQKNRYHTDEVYRKRMIEYAKEWKKKNEMPKGE